MYKILIVEDEEIERRALVGLLQEHFFETLIVYSASNGLEALELLKKIEIHILICDINLPGINGLETIAKAKKINKDVVSLVVTSYNYFEYAKEAIKLGVEDFILKPVSNEKMFNAIYQVINKIDNRESQKNQTTRLVLKIEEIKPIVESDCIHSIVKNSKSSEIERYFSLLNIVPKSGFCLVFQDDSFNQYQIQQFITEVEDLGCCCMMDSYYEVHVLFVFSLASLSKQDVLIFEALIKKYFKDLTQMGVGTICEGFDEFYNSYVSAIENIGGSIRLQKNNYSNRVKLNYDLKKLCSGLINDFLSMNMLGVNRKINLFYLEILYLDKETLLKLIWDFNEILINLFNQEFGFKISMCDKAYVIKIDVEDPYHELLDRINDFIDILVKTIKDIDTRTSNALVKKALDYISINYNKAITLNNVATYLEVTPGYVSNLLSSYTSKNFTDLVTECRIEKAKELLKENYQIKEIASSLGFGSHNYFSKVFKKVTGLTPKEYKTKYD